MQYDCHFNIGIPLDENVPELRGGLHIWIWNKDLQQVITSLRVIADHISYSTLPQSWLDLCHRCSVMQVLQSASWNVFD